MHLFKTHLTVRQFAEKKKVSMQTIYTAIKNKKLAADYAGEKKIAFISPTLIDTIDFPNAGKNKKST